MTRQDAPASTNNLRLIGDAEIVAVSAIDNGEAFVDLDGWHPAILVDQRRCEIASRSACFAHARIGVAKRLADAAVHLPGDLRLYLKEAYRPLAQQTASFEAAVARCVRDNPQADMSTCRRLASQYVAPPETAPHPTGAAINVTLIDAAGQELDLGTAFNAEPWNTDDRTYFSAPHITKAQRAARTVLADALAGAGFLNYEPEWWHWSYGDKYWAYHHGRTALYKPVDESFITP